MGWKMYPYLFSSHRVIRIHITMGLCTWIISTLTDFNNVVGALAIVVSGTVLWENRDNVRESLRARDLVYLPMIWLWLPLVLFSVPVLFGVLEWNMGAFRFHYDTYSLLTTFSSTFIHNSKDHLMSNITGYVVVIPPSLAFALLAQNKKRWYITWWIFLISVPLTGAAVGLLNPPVAYEAKAGFSGVLAAHSALLIISIIAWAKYEAGKRRQLVNYQLLIIPILMAVWYLHPTELFGVVLAIFALLSVIVLTLRQIDRSELIGRLKSPAGILFIIAFLVYIITIQNFMMPTEEGVNVQGHYTGLTVGYAISILGFSLGWNIYGHDD